MKITTDMEKFIKLQRTNIVKGNVVDKFKKSLIDDYNVIKPYLPEECGRILDIGCGLGGIDLLLYDHYAGQPEIHLLDYSRMSDEIYYGYRETGAIYNNLDLTKNFLTMNGVDKRNLAFYDAGANEFPGRSCDVIISLISWGFHYPLETYIEQVRKIKTGIIIMDIRHDTGQIQKLSKEYNVKVIDETGTRKRVVII